MAPIPSFTLGIEEEFQVVDPQTRELKSHIHELFAEGEKRLKDEIKREMHDAVIEVGTPICQDIKHARREITRLRREIITLTKEAGLCIASAGTHPISHWANVPITPHARYDQIVYELQMLARLCQQVAERQLPELIAANTATMQEKLGGELTRLEALKAVNPQVANTELDYLRTQRAELSAAYANARVQLEALRLLLVV